MKYYIFSAVKVTETCLHCLTYLTSLLVNLFEDIYIHYTFAEIGIFRIKFHTNRTQTATSISFEDTDVRTLTIGTMINSCVR